MEKFFIDRIVRLEQHTLRDSEDIFAKISESRKDRPDADRFFLEYLPPIKQEEYNFDNPISVSQFRKDCCSFGKDPLLRMGGYNMSPSCLEDGLKYNGIKMSDPYGRIYGCFDIREQTITYSPISPRFYEERDLVKFASDTYFTTMTFEDIMNIQIDRATSFYVHVGNYSALRDIIKNGEYILEKVDKDKMIQFVSDPKEGEKILRKHLKI